MGRRRQSTAEDIVDLIALLPWWAGVVLAVVSYLILHRLAAPPVIGPNGMAPTLMSGIVIAGLATAGQYELPLLCCVAALVSVARRNKRTALVERASGSASMSAVAEMSWQDFELLIGEAFRLQGFTVVERGGAGPDGGIDLLLKRDGEKFLVQCKHWRSLKVGVSVAREMFGLIAAEGASGAFIVTGGEFTAEAKAFAQGRNLQLIDGKKLSGLLQQAKTNKRASSAPKPPASKPAQAGSAEAPPSCSTCQATMVRRTAKKGQNAGAQFWGCTRYPACRGTR